MREGNSNCTSKFDKHRPHSVCMPNKFRKMVVFDNLILSPSQKARLHSFAEEIVFYPKTDDQALVKKYIKDAEAVINCWTVITEESLKGSSVKYIGNWGHWWKHRVIISENRLYELGIHLDHIPDYGADAVAEVAWAGILALAKNLGQWHKDAETGRWTYENLKTGKKVIQPFEIEEQLLAGKTLGIVGLGRIGGRVAGIGKAFGMKVSYYSKTRKKQVEDSGIKYSPLEELFAKSDIVSIHLPPDAPERLISKELLETMKENSIFVNTSVGKVIDQEALIRILKTGKIKAFLDVYEQFPPKKELKGLPNVIFTYRLGWFTKESIMKKSDILLENIEKFLKTR